MLGFPILYFRGKDFSLNRTSGFRCLGLGLKVYEGVGCKVY